MFSFRSMAVVAALTTVSVAWTSTPAQGQTVTTTADAGPVTQDPLPAPSPRVPSPPPPSQTSAGAFVKRWLELQNATLNLRYRYVDTSAGLITTNQFQHRESLRGRLKFDKPGRYALNFGLFTGVRFSSGWDNTPWGIKDPQRNLAFKTLYAAAQPIEGVEAQIGGLYLVKGESSELTTYDDDGYIMGERVSIRRPKQVFFDEISVTNAYFEGGTGDTSIPVSKRFPHIDEPNYQHYLIDKTIGKRTAVSVDYTTETGRKTWREAVKLTTQTLRVIDSVLLEHYQRVNSNAANGFAVTLDKTVNKHLSINGGYAQIDRNYGALNADRFNIGKHAFVMPTFVFGPVTASFFITTAVGANGVLPQRTLSNTIFTYNVLPALKRTDLF